MSPADWTRIEELFVAALELDEAGRDELLDGVEPSVADEVRRLLAADAGAGRRLESAIAEAAASVAVPPAAGRQIGHYRLERELGRGGMSIVYLARRADASFEQTVAVKLLRHGLANPSLGRRLVAERQILAGLAHPNIARLLDGGTTADGLPYFVMEVIEGVPIDRYCDDHDLNVRQRLGLFREVLKAVDYAHRNLVVHRDLKPSNVLVTQDGTPKLLDFGIAKILDDPEWGTEVEGTQSVLRMGTPGYASPEQISGQPITTASDVYSLGVLLHRLLTGTRPYRFGDSAPIHVIEEAILRQEPILPSVAVRGTSEGLARRLAGDLDNIVAMALRKEPERRYGSVQQLSDDVGRHLDGHPVIARPDTFSYRAGKFVRRNRLAVATTLAAVVLTWVFVAVLVRQQASLARQRDRAEEVSAMLVSLFQVAGPNSDRGQTLTARELLDHGRRELGRLDDQPETQALLRDTLGGLYEELGLFDEAAELFGLALEQHRSLLGKGHPLVAESLYRLGRAKARAGRYDEAEPLFRAALELRREVLGDDHPAVAVSLNSLALVLHEKGDYDGADPLYRQAIEMGVRRGGDDDAQTVKTRANLALLLLDRGDYGEAERLFRLAHEGWDRLEGEGAMTAEVLDGLAQTFAARGDPANAEPLAREALAQRRRLFGDHHPVVARSLAHLASSLRHDDVATAETLAVEALAERRRWLGEGSAETAESLAILASLRFDQGRRDEGEDLYRQAIDVYSRSLSPRHPMAARPVAELGARLAATGDCEGARPLLADAAALLPPRDWRMEGVRRGLERCGGPSDLP